MKKLFIGNIPFQTSETDLLDWFSGHGFSPAEVAIVRHRLTGDSKGFGFAEFSNESDSQQALEQLNGAEYIRTPAHVERGPQRGPYRAGPGLSGHRTAVSF
ncbi:MAG: RNA-binding protein [Acidobacteria bacterium]|nr:RNA-binding protein [Acidobacteriota bacterium]